MLAKVHREAARFAAARTRADECRAVLYRAIREAAAQGETMRAIAKAAGLSHQRVAQIVEHK